MTAPILIISDTHLGRPAHAALSADALQPLWQGMSHVVLNGDIAEVHHPDHRGEAARQAVTLLKLCERDGVEVTMLSGNHDPFISDHRHLELADGRVFVTHGDVLHPAVAPWSPSAGRMRAAHDHALAAFTSDHRSALETRLLASQHASHAEWDELAIEARHSSIHSMLLRPWAILKVLHFWRVFPKLVARFAEEHAPAARFIITGHTHRAGVWHFGERTVINTGAFGFPGRPRGVTLDDQFLTVWPILFDGVRYTLGSTPIQRYPIPAISDDQVAAPSARKARPGSVRPSAAAM